MTPKRVLDRLEAVLGASAPPSRLTTVIETELVAHFGLEAIRAAEKAEPLAMSVAKLIAQRSIEADDYGVAATLVIIGSTSDYIVGANHILPLDTPHVAAAKAGRSQHDSLLQSIRSLSADEFELFGKRILTELGASEAHVTRQSGDQGIDFYGKFSLGQLNALPAPFLKLAHDVRLLFAGQAKHYPNSTLGPNIVRELIGAISLARTKTFSSDGVDIFANLEIRPFSPVVALLFTTGKISSGAYHLASSAGIVVKDGNQLAAFLADRGVGMLISAAQTTIFDEASFKTWLLAES